MDGSCHCCGLQDKLTIDHCHETGRIRGFICHACNVTLAWLEVSADRMEQLQQYLERNQNRRGDSNDQERLHWYQTQQQRLDRFKAKKATQRNIRSGTPSPKDMVLTVKAMLSNRSRPPFDILQEQAQAKYGRRSLQQLHEIRVYFDQDLFS